MRSNKAHIERVQQATETKIAKQYNQEFQKAINAGANVLLTKEEKNNYVGPIHYLTHFQVFNPGSICLRVVADSAFPNVHTKLSLNDCVKAGAYALYIILHVILR